MNYIGSKKTLLPFIEETISKDVKDFKNKVFCDGFSGTGVVGARFKEKGCKVISNDLQYYSYVLNKHYLQGKKIKNPKNLNSVSPIEDGFIYNNYCKDRMYFSKENGKKCDGILKFLKENKDENYYTYLASLLEAMDKVANTTSVYGAYLKKIKKSADKELDVKIIEPIEGPDGFVYNEDINDLILKIQGDILYLDPPYNTRQYSGNYHVLETIAKGDSPELKGKTGQRIDNKKSKFCSKKTVKNELDFLIKNADFKYIYLSYNNEGLLSFQEIKEIFEKYGKYRVEEKKYPKFKSQKQQKKEYVSEYIHVLIKD